jgi:hypothetical protein
VFDFLGSYLQKHAFQSQPMAFLHHDSKAVLATIAELALLEGGPAEPRNTWHGRQLRNLLQHASSRSPFWRARLKHANLRDVDLGLLPVLTRSELRTQVGGEGPLLSEKDTLRVEENATSGSSGVPVIRPNDACPLCL